MSFNAQVVRIPRIGFGWDSHEFKPGITLRIGGVTLPHDSGLAGHSDGDVLLHALTDALLGAVAAGATTSIRRLRRMPGRRSSVFPDEHARSRVPPASTPGGDGGEAGA